MLFIEKVAQRAKELGVEVLAMEYLPTQNEGAVLAYEEGNQFIVWGLFEDVMSKEASFHSGHYFGYNFNGGDRAQSYIEARSEYERQRRRMERWFPKAAAT